LPERNIAISNHLWRQIIHSAMSPDPVGSTRRRREDTFVACPVCRREARPEDLRAGEALAEEVRRLAEANVPGWHPREGLCPDCERRFLAAATYLREHAQPGRTGDILPTPVRLGAHERYRGRGVTIAFLDSGFFAHPDLVRPRDRIVKYIDVTSGRQRRADLDTPADTSWHGMMTSVVACGNGHLSGGYYRGLASDARLVLVKCGRGPRVPHDDIRRGLEWVLRHHRRYGIRVVNVSCGGDYEASYLHDRLSQAAERLASVGVLVCAAVGNRGGEPGHPVLPPASAPSVLTVGGLDDQNRLAFGAYGLYHSSYGPTLDGLQKPEVIAPGIWVAAPILPGTPTAAQAALLWRLEQTPPQGLAAALAQTPGVDRELDALKEAGPERLRAAVREKIRAHNVITADYKHVDGTSFASPIVASVAAQMLEANTALAPSEAKRILISTARRLSGVDTDRQGWGVIDPERAVLAALDERRRRLTRKG
jgi:serine protease AprX